MTTKNYPRLGYAASVRLIERMNRVELATLARTASTSHPQQYDYPTAINTCSESELAELRIRALEIAKRHGYPERSTRSNKKSLFDRDMSALLYGKLDLIETEAAQEEVWNFLTLVVLPDIAKWRYENSGNSLSYNRWLGGKRNVFRKLWWREATLGNALNSKIYEDEAVSVMERARLSGQPAVARAMVRGFLDSVERYPDTARTVLMRAGALRVRQLVPILCLESLTEDELDVLILDVFRKSSEACAGKVPGPVPEEE
ncbi:hypothetical protein [Corynebacterium sp. TAE3-ERU16]|uniref:hypothetical protein n=1 Tax=Corynebacterium sp. TAE3-ERU16 TaxID=2849493 RepID=UPI001C43C172|nr:hypothetical protein [Corynebacterium sp. TAE3-ERU16]MBV7293009.1 hypothetical protein [Corynebacterium sp. TAE3-ERU16]